MVEVSCSLLEWSGSCSSHLEKISTIIEAQCAQCTGNGICSEWYGYLSKLQGLSPDYGKYAGYGSKPLPYCTGNQCEEGTHNCDQYATCTQDCNEYTCACNEGYEGDGTKDYCTKICDEDQCAAEENPCGDFSVCTNECEGFTCECEEGFENVSDDEYVTDCQRICEEGYENVNQECLIICEEGFIRTEENTCFKVN